MTSAVNPGVLELALVWGVGILRTWRVKVSIDIPSLGGHFFTGDDIL